MAAISRIWRGFWVAGFALVPVILSPGWADAQSVLRIARGLTSSDVTVLIDRAIVVDTAQPFVEVSVAQPEIADVSPLSNRSIYILGRRRGATTLTLLGENGQLITNVTVRVEPDLAELKERLNALLPREPIEVRMAGSSIILSGTVSGKAKVDRAMRLARAYGGDNVANMMSVGGTQQVQLKVRIAEMSRSAAKQLGINLGFFSASSPSNTLSFIGGGTGGSLNFGNAAAFDPATGAGSGPVFNVSSVGFGTLDAIFSITESLFLNVTVDALEAKGFARMLAEPTLVALSGSEAEFLAGGEVPIPVQSDEDTVTVEFRPVGVNVNFIPRVLDDDLISINVSAEVSSIDAGLGSTSTGIDIPGFQVRRATTTVELRDGQSFAIAGLYQDDFADTITQVPILGDIPILGSLFRSTDFNRGETELVIMVTVNLVTPVNNEDEIALPTDRVRIPNEAELFLMGETSVRAGGTDVLSQGFDGDFGYIVE